MKPFKKIDAQDIAVLRTFVPEDRFFVEDQIHPDYSHDEMMIYGKQEPEVVIQIRNAEEASKVMAQIKKDAKTTPFDVKGLAQANQLLLSTGLEAGDTRKLIMALGDAVAASGGGNDELQRMAYNLQQVKNLGKASSVDIRQFGMAGIDIYGLLADYLGITKEQAAETEVTFEDLSGALMKASQEGGKYYGGMAKQSQTLNGQISNLKDSFNEFTEILAKNLVPIAQTVLDKLNSLLAKFQELSPETQRWISLLLSK